MTARSEFSALVDKLEAATHDHVIELASGSLSNRRDIESFIDALHAAFDARGGLIADLKTEIAQLREHVAEWQRFNSAMTRAWDDDTDYDKEAHDAHTN